MQHDVRIFIYFYKQLYKRIKLKMTFKLRYISQELFLNLT